MEARPRREAPRGPAPRGAVQDRVWVHVGSWAYTERLLTKDGE